MKKILILGLCILLVGCGEIPDDYVVCGMIASCPETHKETFIGGQCMRCYIPSNVTIEPFNMTKICEGYVPNMTQGGR